MRKSMYPCRTSVALPERTYISVKAISDKNEISMGEVIRIFIETGLLKKREGKIENACNS